MLTNRVEDEADSDDEAWETWWAWDFNGVWILTFGRAKTLSTVKETLREDKRQDGEEGVGEGEGVGDGEGEDEDENKSEGWAGAGQGWIIIPDKN